MKLTSILFGESEDVARASIIAVFDSKNKCTHMARRKTPELILKAAQLMSRLQIREPLSNCLSSLIRMVLCSHFKRSWIEWIVRKEISSCLDCFYPLKSQKYPLMTLWLGDYDLSLNSHSLLFPVGNDVFRYRPNNRLSWLSHLLKIPKPVGL